MILKRIISHKSYFALNMMPIIDIVLLLIIFFVFVCRYIAAENFIIAVPDEATNALVDVVDNSNFITVSVWFDEFDRRYFCAVGSDIVDINDATAANEITALINDSVDRIGEDAIVNVRMEKGIIFSDYSSVIAAISNSRAEDLYIAAFDKQKD